MAGRILRGRKHPVTTDEAEQMVSAYQRGSTEKDIGALFGFDQTTVSKVLRRLGVPTRPPEEFHRRLALDVDFFQTVDSEEKAYWLGFITADGSVSKRGCLIVSLHIKDIDHVAKLRASVRSEAPITSYAYSGKEPQPRLSVACRKMAADLFALGIHPNKTFTVKPWDGPRDLMRHYWRGVVDGDGSVFRHKRGYWMVSLVGNIFIVGGFTKFIEQELGWAKSPSPHASIFTAGYGGHAMPQTVARLLYDGATVYLDRKMASAQTLIDSVSKRAARRQPSDLSKIDAGHLLAMRESAGSWGKVAASLNVNQTAMIAHRRRLGLCGERIRRRI